MGQPKYELLCCPHLLLIYASLRGELSATGCPARETCSSLPLSLSLHQPAQEEHGGDLSMCALWISFSQQYT